MTISPFQGLRCLGPNFRTALPWVFLRCPFRARFANLAMSASSAMLAIEASIGTLVANHSAWEGAKTTATETVTEPPRCAFGLENVSAADAPQLSLCV